MTSLFFISMMNGAAWGGSEELWFSTALHAAKKGTKVACAVYYWPEKATRMNILSEAGCKVYYFPNQGVRRRNFYEKIQYKIAKKILLKRRLRSLPIDEYDISIVNQGYFEVATSVWANFYKRLNKYALLFHNYSEKEIINPARGVALQNWIDHAYLNLFASQRIREILEDRLKITISNAELLMNPITFSAPTTPVPYPPPGEGRYTMIMLAELIVQRKAQDNLIAALSSLKWKERDWTLHLYGKGNDMEMLRKLVAKNEMAGKILLAGHTDNVKAVLENANILLQITHIDAMPLVVVEAMSMSRPVVVSRIGDMPQWVQNGLNGWISEDASIERIDQTLEKAWQQREKWEQMGKESFKIFMEKFPSSPEEYFLQQLS